MPLFGTGPDGEVGEGGFEGVEDGEFVLVGFECFL